MRIKPEHHTPTVLIFGIDEFPFVAVDTDETRWVDQGQSVFQFGFLGGASPVVQILAGVIHNLRKFILK